MTALGVRENDGSGARLRFCSMALLFASAGKEEMRLAAKDRKDRKDRKEGTGSFQLCFLRFFAAVERSVWRADGAMDAGVEALSLRRARGRDLRVIPRKQDCIFADLASSQ
jgi:hypothetical protein